MKRTLLPIFALTGTLLLLAILILGIQPDRAQAASSQTQALRGDVVGAMLFADATDSTLLAEAIDVIDYGMFQWAIFPAGSRSAQLSGATGYALELGDSTISTQAGSRVTSDWAPVRDAGKGLHIVQLIGPAKAEWMAEIEAIGVEIVQYIHPFSFVVYGEQTAVDGLNSAEFTRWQNRFVSDFRVLPAYRTVESRSGAEHRLVAYRGADQAAIAEQLATLTRSTVDFVALNDTWTATNVNLTTETLAQAAQISGVFTIQPIPTDGGPRGEMSNQILVRNFDPVGTILPDYPAWLASVGLDGSGVIVANVDDGIQQTHPDLVNRMLTCTGDTCGGATTSSHGTHTAGIIAADNSSGATLNGFARSMGVAPGANLVEQLYRPTFTTANGMLKIMADSHANEAVISANSWGPSGRPRGYDNDTMQVDIGVRDVDPTTAGNQPLTYILSFMNGFGGVSTQGSPDEAKNIFTIGSTNAQNGNGTQSTDLFSLSVNSAHGPANDGRVIPHMVAPGCQVDSTNSGSSNSFKCGTSMASPHVSGAAALFFEQYRNVNGSDPSPALVKAAFTVIAESLAGNDDADDEILGHPFDNKQGWGLFNMAEVISPTHATVWVDQTHLFTSTGDTWSMNVVPAVPNEPVRVMLTWTDAPGHGLGGNTPAWNNNLDLIGVLGDTTFTGNQFGSDGWSEASMTLDGMNNTEAIFFESIAEDEEIELVVAANGLNSDAVPGNGSAIDQDFALACYNCKVVTDEVTAVDLALVQTQTAAPSVLPSVLATGLAIGTLISYTITRTVGVSGTQAMSSTIVDAQTDGLQILPETIRLNGQLRPNFFNTTTGDLTATVTETINTKDVDVLTYQARVTTGVPLETDIVNHVTASVTVNDTTRNSLVSSEALRRLRALFLPAIMQDSP